MFINQTCITSIYISNTHLFKIEFNGYFKICIKCFEILYRYEISHEDLK